MEHTVENTVTKAMMEQYINQLFESRLQDAMETFVERNDIRLKELSIIERVVRVEEELKALRETFEIKFDASQKEMNARFDAVNTRFEAMDARFDAVNTRFEAMNARFDVSQKAMDARFDAVNTRFEAMNARFSATQWMIGLFVGIPGLAIAFFKALEFFK